MIERNRNPTGRFSNIVFGLAEITDGLIRVMSMGYLHTRLLTTLTRHQVRQHLNRLKKARQAEQPKPPKYVPLPDGDMP